MSNLLMLLILVIAIVIIIVSTVYLKFNASVSMIIASIFVGLVTKLGPLKTVEIVSNGFGDMMIGIGIPIGLGVIFGQLLSETGAAEVIADSILKIFKGKKALFGITIAAMILCIPVFFDVVFIILLPVGMAIAKKLKLPLPLVVGCIGFGAVLGHTLIPPTPSPLAAASILNFDVGVMFLFGIILSIISIFIIVPLWEKIFKKENFWNEEKDVVEVPEMYVNEEVNQEEHQKPSTIEAFAPILITVICIIMGTIGTLMFGEGNAPLWMSVLGDKVVAMLLGAVAAYILGWKYIGKDRSEDTANEGLKQAGTVMLITGTGGSFGAVLTEIGIGDALTALIGLESNNVIGFLIFAYLVAVAFRIAQGSATVAGITSMQIVATMMADFPIHPVYIAIACLTGACSVAHVNDSGFWVVTNMSGFSITGGLKTVTLPMFMATFVIFLISLILAGVFPMA